VDLNELKVGEEATVAYVDSHLGNIKVMHLVMRLGVIAGIKIKKLSSVSTCSEYMVEGQRIAISKDAAHNIIVV